MFIAAAAGLSNPLHVFLLLMLIAVWFGAAWLAGTVARRKGGDFGIYLVAALIVGPALSLILALLAGTLNRTRDIRRV